MIRLDDTSAGDVAAAIGAERRRMGAAATGMVLTLLILADEEYQADATAAAEAAARQHPMRIVTLIPRPHSQETRLDAEVTVGGDGGPGEVAVLRLRGELAPHANSVAVPLLLPDTPVVAFWPTNAPAKPSDDPIGRHAQRRITDAATAEDPVGDLRSRKAGYVPGDTDLAWARLTPWRSALASVFDTTVPHATGGRVSAQPGTASAHLMARWLHHCLHVPVDVVDSPGPGLTEVRIDTAGGPVVLSRPDGRTGTLSRPGAPDSAISLPRRSLAALLGEELRRLDPDDVYGAVLRSLSG